MAEETFKLPGSSYAELVKIIRAYGHAPDESVPKDIADRSGVSPSQVSRNNAFLVSIGILSGGKKKSLTSIGRKLAQSLDFEMPEQIESAWRTIVNENDFMRKIVSAVRIRGGMELSSLRNHVAYSAGAPKKPHAMAGSGSVIDILKASALLREEDGKIVVSPQFNEQSSREAATNNTEHETLKDIVSLKSIQQEIGQSRKMGGVNTEISIQIRIDCKPDEVDQLGAKLRILLDSLITSEKTSEDNE